MLGLGSLLLAWARSPQKFQEMHIFPAKSLFFFLFLLFLGFMLHMTACLMEMPIPACLCGGCLFFFFLPYFPPPSPFFLIKSKGERADCPAWGAQPNSCCGFRSGGEKAGVKRALGEQTSRGEAGSLRSANKMEAIAQSWAAGDGVLGCVLPKTTICSLPSAWCVSRGQLQHQQAGRGGEAEEGGSRYFWNSQGI